MSSSSRFAFSGSTKKDDVSTRLKSMNMKNVENQTKKLEVESRRMEERLQELKLTMGKEKEKRQQNSGDAIWKSGKKGALNTHAKDVLASAPERSGGRIRRVKILKDDPPVSSSSKMQPRPPPAPGTLAFLAQKCASAPSGKVKGPVCGQCDVKGAMVSCIECGEDYCSTCFASFHLRGALKKHRSVPVQVGKPSKKGISPRQSISERKPAGATPESSGSSYHGAHEMDEPSPPVEAPGRSKYQEEKPRTGADFPTRPSIPISRLKRKNTESPRSARQSASVRFENDSGLASGEDDGRPKSGRRSGSGPIPGGSLLDGEYDEEANFRSFQDAVSNWRVEKTTPGAHESQAVVRRPGPLKQTNWVNPSTTSQGAHDNSTVGTSTIAQTAGTSYEPHFEQNSSVSYAEQLLLKKHRKSELPSAMGNSSPDGSLRNSMGMTQDQDLDASDIQNTFEAVLAAVSPRQREHTLAELYQSSFAVVELESVTSDDFRGIDECETYTVEDGPLVEKPKEEPHEGRASHQSHFPGVLIEDVTDSPLAAYGQYNSTVQHDGPTSFIPNGTKGIVSTNTLSMSPARDIGVSEPKIKRTAEEKKIISRPSSRSQGDTMTNGSRPSPRKGSARPKSRAESRAGGSRRPRSVAQKAAEFGPGVLTKTPSEGLAFVARLNTELPDRCQYNPQTMEDFFGLMVGASGGEERVPRDRPTSAAAKDQPLGLPKYTMSNKVYSITPKTWKPERSFSQTTGDPSSSADFGLATDYIGTSQSFTEIDSGWTPAAVPKKIAPENGIETISYTVSEGVSTKTRLTYEADENGSLPQRSQLPQSVKVSLRENVLRPRTGYHDDDINMEDDLGKITGDEEDERAISQLEFELASQTGRLTADGRISRVMDDGDLIQDTYGQEAGGEESRTLSPNEEVASDSFLFASNDHGDSRIDGDIYDKEHGNAGSETYEGGGAFSLRASDLMDDFEEMERQVMEDEVEALN